MIKHAERVPRWTFIIIKQNREHRAMGIASDSGQSVLSSLRLVACTVQKGYTETDI